MKEKEKKSSNFLKILLVMVAIFIGLALYLSKMLEDDKVNTQKRVDEKVIVVTTPMYHPPLNERSEVVELDINKSTDENKTRKIPKGAEYITEEELLRREEENISEGIPIEELYDDSTIIPQDEIDNYKDAVTIPVNDSEGIIEHIPISSLGTPIVGNQNDEYNPSLGTKIEAEEVNLF